MDINISYRHITSTDSLDEKIHQKAIKLKKYFQGRINVEWICSVDKDIHASDVTITGDHFTYHAKAEADSLYKTFDEVIPKLEKQLAKRKDKTRNIIHKK